MRRTIQTLICLIPFVVLSGCNISGTVSVDGLGIGGATVILSGDSSETVTTDKNGKFTFKSIHKGSYTVSVIPSSGYAGNPQRQVKKTYDFLSISNVDFIADASSLREISEGSVIGYKEDNGAHGYLGIPYAKPPVEELRWKSPQKKEAWEGAYLALSHGSKCTQVAGLLTGDDEKDFGKTVGSEDCLYLNLWAPFFDKTNIPKGEDKLPVMLWIHGGGNSSGEGALYDGKVLAERHHLIVITLNYRLGPFGWFAHPSLRGDDATEKDKSGNYGTLDIIQALEWVQENIEHFGGDPNKVTLFGESAGGHNILTMMISKQAEGLFDRAIIQSAGIGSNTIQEGENYKDDPDNPGHELSSREIINMLLVNDGTAVDRENAKIIQQKMTDKEVAEYLYGKENNEIMACYGEGIGGMVRLPKIFRDGLIIPENDMMTLFSDGDFNQVPVIIGTNRDEAKLFMILDPEFVDEIFGLPLIIKDKTYYELTAKYRTDKWKATGVDEIARELKKTGDDIFVYRFDWDEEPNILGIDIGFMLGAAHGLELAYPFGTPENFLVPGFKNIVYTKKNRPGRFFFV